MILPKLYALLHDRTGRLEKRQATKIEKPNLHDRTGRLEIDSPPSSFNNPLHDRTGRVENMVEFVP